MASNTERQPTLTDPEHQDDLATSMSPEASEAQGDGDLRAQIEHLRQENDMLRADNLRLRERVSALEQRTVEGLAEGEGWLHRFFEGIPLGLVRVTMEGAVIFANTEAQRILDLSYDELEQRYITDFQGATYKEDGSECPVEDYPVARCLISGQPQSPQIVGVECSDGSTNWAVFTAIPTFPSAEGEAHDGALVAFVDVTTMQRQRLERTRLKGRLAEAQKLEALGKLAAGVAHDINNIMTVVNGMATMLRDANLRANERSRALEAILRASNRGRDLVSNIMTFARRGVMTHRPIEIQTMLEEIWSLLERAAPSSIDVQIKLQDDLPTLWGDASQLSTALMNLGLNAVDACRERERGRVLLESRWEPGQDSLSLLVQDNGVGIQPDDLDKVLDPFFTTKGHGKGSGLGLSMAYGTVRNHGGELSLASTPSEGTTVTLRLPVGAQGADAHARRLLVVFHEMVRLEPLLGELQQELGLEVLRLSNGREALEILQSSGAAFGMVLLDVGLKDVPVDKLFESIHDQDLDLRAGVLLHPEAHAPAWIEQHDCIAQVRLELLDEELRGFLEN